jgi:hypothetical protein
MPKSRTLIVIAASVVLAACASPDVDTSAPAFDETAYAADLDACRGGTVVQAALNGLGGAVVGSAYGFLYGVYLGAVSGDSAEGALVGTIVGSVVGTVAGAIEPIKKQEQNIRQCLSEKGYMLGS